MQTFHLRRLVATTISSATVLGSAGIAGAQYAIFSGPNDTISVPGNTVVTTAFTMEARVWLFDSNPTGRIYSEQANAQEDKSLRAGPGSVGGGAWTGPAYEAGVSLDYQGEVCPNRWHHVAFVRDGASQRLYLNGELVASNTWAPPIANSPISPRSIGAFQYTVGGEFHQATRAAFDFVRVSDVARYTGELFTPPTERELVVDTNTLLLFTFDEVPGSTIVHDSGPDAHHGTVGVGFPGATAPTFTASLPSPADLNGDGVVNVPDLLILLGQWGTCPDRNDCPCTADLNDDGVVGVSDLLILLANWG